MVDSLYVSAFICSVVVGVLVPYLLQLVVCFFVIRNGLYAGVPFVRSAFFREVADNRRLVLVATIAVVSLVQTGAPKPVDNSLSEAVESGSREVSVVGVPAVVLAVYYYSAFNPRIFASDRTVP
jgi:hypothetical protein